MSTILNSLDDIAPSLRLAAERWPSAPGLRAHYDDLTSTYERGDISLIEVVNSYIESVCLTILEDEGADPAPTASMALRFKEACRAIGLNHARGASSFDKVLSRYRKLTDSVVELRNSEGAIAHGKIGSLDEFCKSHLRSLVVVADATVGLLLTALDGTEPNLVRTRREFRTFEHLNRRIDAAVTLSAEVLDRGDSVDADEASVGQILSLEFTTDQLDGGVALDIRPSELLFALDRNAYLELLNASPKRPNLTEQPSEALEEDQS